MPGLCSLNELKAILLVPEAESGLDTVLQAIIDSVTADCGKFCDRTFLKTGYSNQAYDGEGKATVVLKQYPVNSAETFQLKDYDPEIGLTIADTADYAVDYDSGVVRLRGGLVFADGPDTVQVTYSAGYALAGTGSDQKIGVPSDLSDSVAQFSAEKYRRRIGAVTEESYEAASNEALRVWSRYRKVR